MADPQAPAVYAAEDSMPTLYSDLAYEYLYARGFDPVGLWHARQYVWAVRRQPWFAEQFGWMTIAVEDGHPFYIRGSAAAATFKHRILLPADIRSDARIEMVVLHEMAHVINNAANTGVGHGLDFVRTMVALVRGVHGEKAAASLADAYRAQGIKLEVTTDEG